MESNVDQVRAARIQAKELAVGHVRNPREGMPVVGLTVNEGPFHASPREPGTDGGVVVNVSVVVVGYELVMARGPIDGERDEDEERAGKDTPPATLAGRGRVHARILGGNGRMPRFFTCMV